MRWTGLARLAGLAIFGTAACGSSGSDAASTGDDLTSVTPPKPAQQAIGNCWVFATNAWIEAMSARPAGATPVDLSEAYISYLYWLDQISAPPGPFAPTLFTLRPVGSWGLSADLLSRFGWMTEATFLSTANPGPFAERHMKAFEAVQHEIAHGALQTPEQRADRKHVAEVLAAAWELAPGVTSDMTRAFGDDYTRTILTGNATLAGTRIRPLTDITIGYANGGVPVTAQDVVGTLPDGEQAFSGVRAGPFAYSDIRPPGSEDKIRGFVRRIQRSLNQDLPVVLSETSDDDDIDAKGVYQKPADGVLSDHWYAHAVMAFDLSVQTAQFGLLPAGVPETRPEAIAASVLDDSTVISFRARNSYRGRYADGSVIPFAGGVATSEYTLDYLMWRPNFAGGRMLLRATIPNDPEMTIGKTP